MSLQQLAALRAHFVLQQCAKSSDDQPNSAVVLPICWHQQRWCLLMTRRALQMRHHPGQLSFPGGRIDGDETPWQAALRELSEEIGVDAQHVDYWGQLPAINTSTGFVVQPYVVQLSAKSQIQVQPSEVDSVLYIPIEIALASPNWRTEQWQLRGRSQQLHFLAIGPRLIWGASAQMLRQFAMHVAPWPNQHL